MQVRAGSSYMYNRHCIFINYDGTSKPLSNSQGRRIEKHESGNSFIYYFILFLFIFFWGGGGVSEKVKTLGETPPRLNYRLPRTVKN